MQSLQEHGRSFFIGKKATLHTNWRWNDSEWPTSFPSSTGHFFCISIHLAINSFGWNISQWFGSRRDLNHLDFKNQKSRYSYGAHSVAPCRWISIHFNQPVILNEFNLISAASAVDICRSAVSILWILRQTDNGNGTSLSAGADMKMTRYAWHANNRRRVFFVGFAYLDHKVTPAN